MPAYQGAQWVVIPSERFDEKFFRLSTRVAGEIIQKFVQYRVGIVVLGDITPTRRPARRSGTSSASAIADARPGSSPTSGNCGSG